MNAQDKPDNVEKKLVTRWAPIVGLWDVRGEQLVYRGPQPGQPKENSFGLSISDFTFFGGQIDLAVTFEASSDKSIKGIGKSSAYVVLGYRSPSDEYFLAGLAGWDDAYTISKFYPAYGWRRIVGAGSRSNLLAEQPYHVNVQILGQRVSLKVDGIRVLEHVLEKPISTGPVALFAWNGSAVTFSRTSVIEREGQRKAFVVMAFDGPYFELYTEVITKVAKECGLYAYNVGEVVGPGLILDDIVRGIADAKVVIAEITTKRENVFYELGYAHALNIPTIMLAERGRDLPFDIRGFRCVFYENTIAGKAKIENALRQHLRAIPDE